MKLIFKIILALLTLILIFLAASFFYLKSTAPDYEGQIELKALKNKVQIFYDDFGVPHIYAQNNTDGYFALGYAHARERLFQMEMIRRATSGQLSEILGPDLLKTDKLMLSLGIAKAAKASYEEAFKSKLQFTIESQAYLDGVNAFIDEDNLPIEFKLIGFKPEHFKPVDIYKTIGYMSLSFTSALSNEPLMTKIYNKLGEDYLVDFNYDSISNSLLYNNENELIGDFLNPLYVQDELPVPIWEGSNNWVISADRSETGKVLLANDTHIKYSQPAVWFEAHLNYPGFEMFGYYLAGVPYAVIGQNKKLGWGITIFPFDNMDLYAEKLNPENKNQYLHGGQWLDFKDEKYTIKVKGNPDVDFTIRNSIHGPIMNPVISNVDKYYNQPISMWWALNNVKTTSLQALYQINNAQKFTDFEAALPLIDIVGLNMLYGDADDNIAWWATGAIPIRDKRINSKLILDGSDTINDFKGFYSFDKNPKSINPEDGLLCTANNSPGRVDGIEYPGYYYPAYRADRIKYLLNTKAKWNLDGFKQIQLDVYSLRDKKLRNLILSEFDKRSLGNKGEAYLNAMMELEIWDARYETDRIGASIYTSVVYNTLKLMMQDELGEELFEKVVSSMPVRSSLEKLFENEKSPWWDDINTKDKKESRKEIFQKAVEISITDMVESLGEDADAWRWGKLHTLTHVHPVGKKEPLNLFFNVGPFPDRGGNEVVLKEAFKYSSHGPYKSLSGPALRLLIDFADVNNSLSIIPTGQSGNIFSKHYKDQARMFVNGEYRLRHLNKADVERGRLLELLPE